MAHLLRRFVPIFAAALLLSFAAVTARAQVALPAAAIGGETAVVVWVDLARFEADDFRATVARINRSLPAQIALTEADLQESIDPQLEEMRLVKEALVAAGVKGFAIVRSSPVSPDADDQPIALVHVAPGVTGEKLAAVIQQARPAQAALAFTDVADGWLTLDNSAPLPAQGNAAAAAAFADLLGKAGDAPIRVAFRATPSIKQATAQAQGNAIGDPVASTMGLFQSVQSGWTAVFFGPAPRITQTLAFDNAQTAQEFKMSWDGLLMMGQGVVMGQSAQLPNAPTAQAVQAFFNTLRFQHAGDQLSLTLGDSFIDSAAEVLPPIVQPLMMMMLMGGAPGGPGIPGAPGMPGMGGPMGQ